MRLRSPYRLVVATCGLACALFWAPLAAAAAPADLTRVGAELEALVVQADREGVAELERRVEDGLPPEALTALLDACRAHPRSELEPVLRTLAEHRTSAIRARALLALAELGPLEAVAAVKAAANDRDHGVRRLAVVLGRLHPSDRVDAIVESLLEHDPSLAEEVRDVGGVAAPQEPAS